MKAQFINLFWSVCKKGRGCQEPCRRCSRGWAKQACCLHHRSTARAPPAPRLVAPAPTFGRVRGEMVRSAGMSPLPRTLLARGQPQAAREAVGSSLARQHQHGAAHAGAREVAGCSGRVKAFQTEIPQQKAGSALELKSKC